MIASGAEFVKRSEALSGKPAIVGSAIRLVQQDVCCLWPSDAIDLHYHRNHIDYAIASICL